VDPVTAKTLDTLVRSSRLRRWAIWLGSFGAVIPVVILLITGWLVISLISTVITPSNTAGSELAGAGGQCGPQDSSTVLKASEVEGDLDSEQAENAAVIVTVGKRLGIPDKGIVIALATASQESGIRNLNYGDRDSLGLFQQRPSTGWGTPAQIRDPIAASEAFFGKAEHTGNGGLTDIADWQQMSITRAAQAVQRSAFPDAYADDEPLAWRILGSLLGQNPNADAGSVENAGFECTTTMAGGTVGYPLPADSGYIDNDNYGERSSIRSGIHTGTDYSVACGVPVLASHAGTVVLEPGPGWFGQVLVKVSTGPDDLTTWYAHMQSVSVTNGQSVNAGQVIGEVGSEGNSTGCHLHFEVHPENGAIYEDDIDPVPWLAEHVGKPLPGISLVSAVTEGTARIASFNVLGHSHTASGERGPGWATGPQRMTQAVDLIDSYNASVVGFQEFQTIQAQKYGRLRGSAWGIFHDPSDTENAVTWRTDTWLLERSRLIRVPYFNGKPRRMPVVRLRHAVTGQRIWFVNVHNPASTGRFPNQAKWRAKAISIERELVADLSADGLPVVILGDFNDREKAFCPMTRGGLLTASAGGSNSSAGCQAPAKPWIDWIFATPAVEFTGHVLDRSTTSAKVSDHPLVVADLDTGGDTG